MMFTLSTPFDVKATFESGQPIGFLWDKIRSKPDMWWYPHDKGLVEVFETSHGMGVVGIGDVKDLGNFVMDTFRLSDNMPRLYQYLGDDPLMKKMVQRDVGLRLCKVGLWEALACMIISQNNNLARIRQNVQDLKEFGTPVQVGSITTHYFPRPEELTKQTLNKCSLGYRCDYLWGTAKEVASGGLKGIEKKPTEQAREILMELPGVGRKVADCVLLFGLGRLDVFPTDVWIEKIMQTYYHVKPDKIQAFAEKRWGAWRGYAQQHLYYWALTHLKRGEPDMGKKKKKRK
jgi:N-glycosylase/DNA lyase